MASTVERPTREVIKLLNIEDTSFYEDIENARKISQAIIDDGPEFATECVLITTGNETHSSSPLSLPRCEGSDEYYSQIVAVNIADCTQDVDTELGVHGFSLLDAVHSYVARLVTLGVDGLDDWEGAGFGAVQQMLAEDDPVIYV